MSAKQKTQEPNLTAFELMAVLVAGYIAMPFIFLFLASAASGLGALAPIIFLLPGSLLLLGIVSYRFLMQTMSIPQKQKILYGYTPNRSRNIAFLSVAAIVLPLVWFGYLIFQLII